MKKIYKVLIAFAIIVVLAVGAYFIFRKKDNTSAIFNNVYNLTYNFKSGNNNVVDSIDNVVDDMINVINTNSLEMEEIKNDLMAYTYIRDNYFFIRKAILQNGKKFAENSAYVDKIEIANKKIAEVKEIYFNSYAYLSNTYYKIVGTEYNVQTMKDYIINFHNIFKDILKTYNEFYYNTCIAYCHCYVSTMLQNNAYKLKLEYLGSLINEYYLNNDTREQLLVEILSTITNLENFTAQTYYNNKAIYDDLFEKTFLLNIGQIGLNNAKGEIENYINQLPNEADRKLAQNYQEKVVKG